MTFTIIGLIGARRRKRLAFNMASKVRFLSGAPRKFIGTPNSDQHSNRSIAKDWGHLWGHVKPFELPKALYSGNSLDFFESCSRTSMQTGSRNGARFFILKIFVFYRISQLIQK
jgi:hypothetical protein